MKNAGVMLQSGGCKSVALYGEFKVARIFIISVLVFLAVSCDSGAIKYKVGDTDNTGNSGDTGNTGNTGDTGNTGNTGNTGDSANTGNTGNSGDTGDSGNTGTDTANTGDDADNGNTGDTGNTGCETANLGNTCSVDSDCGRCMICTKGGKCTKGCIANADCTMATGLKCNKKLARCTNVYASSQACGETKCPAGCCYAEKGLTAVKCLAIPEASKCGNCPQSEIYIPSESKCVSAVCSTITDNCPVLNAASTSPKPSCFGCESGAFICKADSGTSGCSSGVLVNVFLCMPAGRKCSDGASQCCSGMPCIQGYCY